MTDLQAAAERLRRDEYPNRVDHSEEWDSYFFPMQKVADMTLLSDWAMKKLAANPADDALEITEAWLRSVGGRQEDNPLKITFERKDTRSVGLWKCRDGWKAVLLFDEGNTLWSTTLVRGLRTHRDLRRLADALRIELKS